MNTGHSAIFFKIWGFRQDKGPNVNGVWFLVVLKCSNSQRPRGKSVQMLSSETETCPASSVFLKVVKQGFLFLPNVLLSGLCRPPLWEAEGGGSEGLEAGTR